MTTDDTKQKPAPTLWTAAAPIGQAPVPEAKLDPTVTRERIEKALEAAEKRAAAFTKRVTEEMLLKRY